MNFPWGIVIGSIAIAFFWRPILPDNNEYIAIVLDKVLDE